MFRPPIYRSVADRKHIPNNIFWWKPQMGLSYCTHRVWANTFQNCGGDTNVLNQIARLNFFFVRSFVAFVVVETCSTHSKWTLTSNETVYIRCVVNSGSSSINTTYCMRRQLSAWKAQTYSRIKHAHLIVYMSHITVSFASILFSYFYLIYFQSNSHSNTKCLFSLLSRWETFEPILGFQLYVVHVSRSTFWCRFVVE